jgi:hypothetical protein
VTDRHLGTPCCAQLPAAQPRTPELRLLHRWLDTSSGVGLIVVGVERYDYWPSLSDIAEGVAADLYGR